MAKSKKIKVEERTLPPADQSTPLDPSDGTSTFPQTPEPPQAQVPSGPRQKIEVDKFLLFKMMKMCVQGYSAQLNKHSAVAKFGACLGGINQLENKAIWDAAQKYLAENKG